MPENTKAMNDNFRHHTNLTVRLCTVLIISFLSNIIWTFRCHECGKELASELTYEKHIIHHLPEDKRPFKCEHCLRRFVYKESLKAHLRSHLPDIEKYAFACNACGKK